MQTTLRRVFARIPFVSGICGDTVSLCRLLEEGKSFLGVLQRWIHKGASNDKHLLLHPRAGFMASQHLATHHFKEFPFA